MRERFDDRRRGTGAASAMRALAASAVLAAALGVTHAQEQTGEPAAASGEITLSGTVAEAGPERFILDYGTGLVTVEMPNWEWYAESYELLQGDQVIVAATPDADSLEQSTIEAESVYAPSLNTYFYPRGSGRHDRPIAAGWSGVDRSWDNYVGFTGRVASIDGRELRLDTGDAEVVVDTSTMEFNPLDDVGYEKIDTGDRIWVAGRVNSELFESRRLLAAEIVLMREDRGRQEAG